MCVCVCVCVCVCALIFVYIHRLGHYLGSNFLISIFLNVFRKVNIFGCVIFFFFWILLGVTAKLDYMYLYGSCQRLFKVKVLNWNYFLDIC